MEMETTDKVTLFGNIAHNLIEEIERYIEFFEVRALKKKSLDQFFDVTESVARNFEMFEILIKENRPFYTLSSPLVLIAELGMAGYYLTHFGDIALNAIANQMTDLYARKNRDYGNSFDKSMDKFGLVVAAIRIGDKVNRLQSLVAKGGAEVKDESIADTFIDLACYSIMTLMWMEGKAN